MNKRFRLPKRRLWMALTFSVAVLAVTLLAFALAQPTTATQQPPTNSKIAAPFGPAGILTIGDTVWYDANQNGEQDLGETGINGVVINLWLDNGDGILGDGDTLLDTKTTADNPDTGQSGYYQFEEVAGNETYFVEIDDINFQVGHPLYNHVLTSQGTFGPNPMTVPLENDSYADADFGYYAQSTSTIEITKSANPTSVPEPGGDVTFTVVVHNPNPSGNLTITSLTDSIYGNLANQPGCSDAIGYAIAPGEDYTCQFVGHVTGNAGDTETDTVTVTANDPLQNEVSASDDATVSITDVQSSMQVLKGANPNSLQEPGGNVLFTVEVRNTSTADAITIENIQDSVYGDLSQRGTCTNAVGTILQPGTSYTCQFSAQVTGNAGDSERDVVTVTAVDDDQQPLSDSDDAEVVITNAPSSIRVTKTANPPVVDVPGGDVTFTVQVENLSAADAVTITQLVDDVFGDLNGQGNCTTGFVLQPGESHTCQFTGYVAGNNGDMHTDTVTATGIDDDGQPLSADDSAVVQIGGQRVTSGLRVSKSVEPKTVRAPGGWVTYRVVIRNTTADIVDIFSLEDNVYGDLNGKGTCHVPQRLNPTDIYECTFQEYITGNANDSETDIVTAKGYTPDGRLVWDADSATVNVTGTESSIELTKTADPVELVEPGGLVHFTVVITNTSPNGQDVTITSLNDTIYGDLSHQGTCRIPQTIPVGQSYQCIFLANFTGQPGYHETDIVTAEGQDEDGRPVSSSDSADVRITDSPSSFTLEKTADPEELPEPGGRVTFHVTIQNTSPVDDITIDTLVDTVYGNLNGKGTCSVPQTLAPNQTYTCQFDANVTGNGGDSETDIVVATGTDDDDNPLHASDDAVVRIIDVPSSIVVTKTANPTSVPEPGGDVTFTVVVVNTSPTDQVTIQSMVDDIHGDLNQQGTCSVPQVLDPGEAYTCSFQAHVSGEPGDKETDVVTIQAVDDDGNPLSARDDAEVTITDLPPTLEVIKTATPTEVSEPGGNVTFQVTVRNTSASDTVRLLSLVDSIFGDLNGKGTCSVPQELTPGQTYTCSFQEMVRGREGDIHTNVVVVSGVDEENNPVAESDDAEVTIGPPSSQPGCVSGYKVDDLHVGLPAWRIHARPVGATQPEYVTQTDGTGYFEFRNLTPGRWELWEEMEDGWEPVTAPQFEVTVNGGDECVQVRFKNRQVPPTPTPTFTPAPPTATLTPTYTPAPPTATSTPVPTVTPPPGCEAGRLEFNIWGTDYSIPLWDDDHVWSVWGLPWQYPTVFTVRNYNGSRLIWLQYQPYYHKQEGGNTFVFPGGHAGEDFTMYLETDCGKLQLQGAVDDPTVTPVGPNRVWVPVIIRWGTLTTTNTHP